MGSGLKRLGAVLVAGFAAMRIGSKLMEFKTAASDLNETINKSNVVFGNSSAEIMKWSEQAATSFGLSQQAALEQVSTFGEMFRQLGQTQGQAAKTSESMIKLAADLGSFHNVDPSEVLDMMSSAMRGEFDPIQRLIPNINALRVEHEALAMGIAKPVKNMALVQQAALREEAARKRLSAAIKEHGETSFEARSAANALQLAEAGVAKALQGQKVPLTEAQKAMTVLGIIQKDGANATNDFAETSAGLANQQRILAAQMQDLKTKAGQALLPTFVALANVVTTKIMPPIVEWAQVHGPALGVTLGRWTTTAVDFISRAGPPMSKFFQEVGPKIRVLFSDLRNGTETSGSGMKDIGQAFKDARSELSSLSSQLPSFNDLISVSGVVLKFLASHLDLVRKSLPLLVAGYVLFKAAQVAANVAQALSLPMKVAEIAVNYKLVAANRALLVSQASVTGAQTASVTATTADVVATEASTFSRIKNRIATIASTAATYVARGAVLAWTGAQWLLNVALNANPIGLVVLGIAALVAAFVIAWKNSDTFRRIVMAAWAGIKTAAQATVDWIRAAWPTYIQPTLRQIGSGVAWLWNAFKTYFTFMANIYLKVFQGMMWAWRNVLSPTFSAIGTGIGWVRDGFRVAVRQIGEIWGRLRDAAASPVRFVINTVYNNGIRSWWNKISGVFHGPTLPLIRSPFASGGIVPGVATPGRDNQLAAVGSGEAIMRPEWTRAVGASTVYAWNRAARTGGTSGVARAMGLRGFADGGVVDLITNPRSWVKPLDSMLQRIEGSAFGKMLAGGLRGLVGRLTQHVSAKASSLAAGAMGAIRLQGGGNAANRSLGASMASQMYGWTGTNWVALNNLWNGESGWNHLARNPSSGAYGIPQSLPASKMATAGGDWMTNPATQIRWGLGYIKSAYGSPANAYSKWLNRSPHWYDTGGWLPPGLSLAYNGTGRHERVLGPKESTSPVFNNYGVVTTLEVEDWFVKVQRNVKRKGRE